MRERINKPRVFLSHARKDVAFIERIESDLRKCQIEPWRDQNEIRDGQPWMQAIFEDGIPTCDAILAYFTENSLNSGMVEKEVDSAILRRLADNKIAFLPYVDDDKTREKLRVDIQTLQCRVWNDENYEQILPTIVAQIWQSYLERSIENAVLQERNRRLELELEVKSLKEIQGEDIFTQREEKEFQYIFNKLDFTFDVLIPIYNFESAEEETEEVCSGYYKIRISFLQFLLNHFRNGNYNYDDTDLPSRLEVIIRENKILDRFIKEEEQEMDTPELDIKFSIELVKYGLVELANDFYAYQFTNKMNRFLFWLEYKNLMSTNLLLEYIEFTKEKN